MWCLCDLTPFDSLDLYVANRERTHLHLFQFSLRDQASNWLERLLAGSISTWEYFTTRFLAQFFPQGRTSKLRKDILMFQQHRGESLSEAWTRFKDLLQKVPHHGQLRKMSAGKTWTTIEELARYEDEGWNDPIFLEEGILNYKNSNMEQLLGVMEHQVDTLMKDAISLMGKSKNLCGNTMHQLLPEPSHQEAFEDLVMNFILDQEEKVLQMEEYMCVIRSDFMRLSLEVVERLKEMIRVEENRVKKIEKITRYPDTEDQEPLNSHKLSRKRHPSIPLILSQQGHSLLDTSIRSFPVHPL
ncbi:zinc finger, CCHC-type containing protein [Tanacetum coccineum]|uniref:Zinc finger, CCHC-type containing protein n=1 Tax=Tanacetum coccineum TaxID=301880 RepID=A0ABQ5AKE1_9ASTR